MKFIGSAFYSDRLYLTWKDLFLLAIGRELKVGALIIKRETEAEAERIHQDVVRARPDYEHLKAQGYAK